MHQDLGIGCRWDGVLSHERAAGRRYRTHILVESSGHVVRLPVNLLQGLFIFREDPGLQLPEGPHLGFFRSETGYVPLDQTHRTADGLIGLGRDQPLPGLDPELPR